MRAFFRRHILVAFFVIAFLLSWYPWIMALNRGQTSGPNPLGPFVAAIIMTAIVYGRAGLRKFFSQLVRWRVGAKNYGIVFMTPIFICMVAAGITVLIAEPRPSALTIEKLREVPERFLFIFLFIGLGEEPGWRGFALPELQKKYSPLIASLILAPIWAIWHLPLVGKEFPWPIVPAFLLSLFGATFMLTWLFNRTNGSVLLPMLFHATVNSVGAGLIFPLFIDRALLALWYIYGAIWLCLGLATLLLEGKQLKRAKDKEGSPPNG